MNRLKRIILGFAIGVLALPAMAQNCMLRDGKLRGSYVGDCVRGWANGQGRAEGQDQYDGAFVDGHAHGQGVYTFADGSRFEGRFAHGRVTGRARFYYPGGDVLEGEFRNNRLVGVGQLRKPGGELQLVELRGATLMVIPQAPPVQVAVPGANPSSPTVPAGPDVADARWSPVVDLEDLFPSYILATATRRSPQAGQTRAAGNPRADDEVSFLALPRVAEGPTARVASLHQGVTYVGDPWGLVGVRVRAERPNTRVALRISIDGVAEPTDVQFDLPTEGVYALYPKLNYRWDALRDVAQPAPVNVRWSMSIDGAPAGSQTRTVQLRATRDVPFVVVGERGPEYLGWVFSAFVTEDAPWIDTLLGEAFKGQDVRPLGYQGGPKDVIAQVAVVYQYLRSRGIRYSSITTGSGDGQRVASQTVRFPSDSIRSSQANCIDGTVLMASILRKIDIEAYIITGPGHAMLGFSTKRKPANDRELLESLVVVETTALGEADIGVAIKAGNAKFVDWYKNHRSHLSFGVIPVSAMRAVGVMPIAR